ncbi:MAG: type III-A CRISPR-associated protein Cas10/Csm1 [Halanaerobiales bacterium]|nr:type III-A CRISPR-associated protein Cas10/Csm1 [Halanaerobiales bacterium]
MDKDLNLGLMLIVLDKYIKTIANNEIDQCYQQVIQENKFFKLNIINKKIDFYRKILKSAESLSLINLDRQGICQPLKSIFSSLFEAGQSYYYLPKQLSLNSLFPKRPSEKVVSKDFIKKLHKLVGNFIEEMKSVKSAIQLYYLTEKYFWSVSCSQKNPDISFFQYMKTVLAISKCLAEQHKLGKISDKDMDEILSCTSNQFVLIKGDLSGIQDFIFNIQMEGAAKSLKGRSVYLELLSDIVIEKILDELDLDESNLLYNGGGNFYILIPQTKIEEIKKLREEILKILMKIHRGQIYLAMGNVEFSPAEMKNFADIWKRASDKVGELKKRKWSEIGITKHFGEIFGPIDEGSTRYCEGCGNTKDLVKKSAEETETLCELCNSFKQLTNKLRFAKYLYIIPCENHSVKKKDYNYLFSKFGYKIYFESEVNKELSGRLFKLNCTNFLKNSDGYKFGAFILPESDERQITFDELANNSIIEKQGNKKGDKKLGYLKLDVDNLGSVFIQGFGDQKSIARVTTLSQMLSLYFKGYLNNIIKENDWQNDLYVVFSGGDDTFIIGAWPQLLKFTQLFRKDFNQYTCENPRLSFSAGVAIFPPKFPVAKAVSLTEDALEDSKNYLEEGENIPLKNRVSLFGEVFNWEEFTRIETIKEFLVDLIDNKQNRKGKPIGRSLLHKVMKSTLGFKDILKESANKNLNNLKFWRLAHYLREVKREDADKLLDYYRDIVIHNLMSKPREDKIKNIMIIPAAVRWAELETKVYKDEEEKE